jgi:hypothetical protein
MAGASILLTALAGIIPAPRVAILLLAGSARCRNHVPIGKRRPIPSESSLASVPAPLNCEMIPSETGRQGFGEMAGWIAYSGDRFFAWARPSAVQGCPDQACYSVGISKAFGTVSGSSPAGLPELRLVPRSPSQKISLGHHLVPRQSGHDRRERTGRRRGRIRPLRKAA